jgi:hypothetical protein
MDQIFGDTDNRVIADYRIVKLNGQKMIPFNLFNGQAIFMRTEDGSGDTLTYEHKKNTSRKIAVLCNVKSPPDRP